MIVSHNQKMAVLLVHRPCLAVAGPVLREPIAIPFSSVLKAISPLKFANFAKISAHVCIYLLNSTIPPTTKTPLAAILHALDGTKKDQPSRLILLSIIIILQCVRSAYGLDFLTP